MRKTQVKIPSLKALHAFERVAHLGSVKLAAEALCVTEGAVSRLLSQLEQQLAIVLFDRTQRSLRLTPSGRTLQHSCHHAFEILREGLEQLEQPRTEHIVVSCEPTFAMRWLIPRLPDFYRQYPDIPVQLMIAGGAIDFALSDVDVAIRRNDFVMNESLHSEVLCEEWIAPVLHASYTHTHSNPVLDAHIPKLHTHTRPKAWQTWALHANMSLPEQSVLQELWYEHFYVSLQAAQAQLGIAIASIYMVGQELQTQVLSNPQPFIKDGSSYTLITPSAIENDSRIVCFRDWISVQLQHYLLQMQPFMSIKAPF